MPGQKLADRDLGDAEGIAAVVVSSCLGFSRTPCPCRLRNGPSPDPAATINIRARFSPAAIILARVADEVPRRWRTRERLQRRASPHAGPPRRAQGVAVDLPDAGGGSVPRGTYRSRLGHRACELHSAGSAHTRRTPHGRPGERPRLARGVGPARRHEVQATRTYAHDHPCWNYVRRRDTINQRPFAF